MIWLVHGIGGIKVEPIIRRHGKRKTEGFTSIKPLEILPNTNPKSLYVAQVKVMYGDADFYETIEFKFRENSDEDLLIDFLNFLEQQVAPAYSNGRGGDDRYETVVKDWYKWFSVNDCGDYGVFCDEWPSKWDLGGEATLENVSVVFFNESGEACSVGVV